MQSSKYSADYLEYRINNFMDNLSDFPETKINNIKEAIIKEYMQVDLNLVDETASFLSQMEEDENYSFNRKARMIEEIKKVTVDQVNHFILEKIRCSVGRMVVKFMSKNHLDNTIEIEDAKQKNKEFYEKWQIEVEEKFIEGSIP